MTIIIALAHEDGVTIGSDRFACNGNFVVQRNKQKWLELPGGFWVASSGAADIREILQAVNSDPESDCNLEVDRDPYKFCFELRKRLRDAEHWCGTTEQDGGPVQWGASLLMTDGERVWETTHTLYPILVDPGQPSADGSGWSFALGAMHAAGLQFRGHMKTSTYALKVVETGLAAAIHYDTQSGGEPWVETITKKEKT